MRDQISDVSYCQLLLAMLIQIWVSVSYWCQCCLLHQLPWSSTKVLLDC